MTSGRGLDVHHDCAQLHRNGPEAAAAYRRDAPVRHHQRHVNLQGPTTTTWDKMMVSILAIIAGVEDINLLSSQQFKAKSNTQGPVVEPARERHQRSSS